MAKLFNRAKMTTSTTGSGTVTLGSASVGYQSFADAGVSNGDVVQYVIEEGGNFEIGTGTYSATGTSLTRSPTESSNSGAAISLGGAATVSITAVADDLNRLQHEGSTKVEPTSTGATVTGNLAVTGTVDGRDVAADGTKLDGIEAGADVTDTANVTAAGALMDSEVTNLAQVKAFDSSDYATAAQGTTADAALARSGGTMTGAITFAAGQTFDGRDVSADGSKLDGIESGATADQTAAEIRSLVESATDSNVFTDADHTKLNGIESNATADQTASEILTAIKTVDGSGSGLDADTLDGSHASAFLTGNQTITLSGDASGSGTTSIAVSLAANSVAASEIAANAVGASELNVTGNGTTSQFLRSDGDGTFSWATPTDTNTTYSTATSSALGLVKIGYTENGKNYPVELSSGQMFVNVPWTDTDTNTTYSAGTNLSLSGTTFNVDDAFVKNTGDTITGRFYIDSAFNDKLILRGSNDPSMELQNAADAFRGRIGISSTGKEIRVVGQDPDDTNNIHVLGVGQNGLRYSTNNGGTFYNVWHANNDGSGSGLDADTLDGNHASAFLTGNQTISLTGDATGSGTTSISVSLSANSVGASEIAANAVGASELNVTGNGTTAQFLRSDGDGTFTWATPTDTNTTYSAGTNLSLSGTTFNVSSTPSFTSATFGSGVTLQESTDRADLLQITSSTSSWGGLQIRNSSNEGRWSFMTNGSTAGIYDDENNDWHIQMSENGGVTLYANGTANFTTGTTYMEMARNLDMNNYDIYGVDQIFHHADTNTYTQFQTDQWRVVVGGTERLEVRNYSPHVLVTGDLNSTSDARLKENVEPITNALSDVTQLEGVSFDWKDTGTRGHGFIAQQVEPILPDVVQTDEETGIKSINYVGMIGHLVEAIKEQQEQINALKKQLNG